MIASSIKKGVRAVSLGLIVALTVWLLWPPKSEPGAQKASAGEDEPVSRSVKHVIRFSPGIAYLPGVVPFGFGEPLDGVNQVVARFEERFPDTRIEILNVPGVREYLVTQLSSGQAPDILNVNVEDVWVDVQKGWYVALDPYLQQPNPFVREQGDPDAPGYDQWWDMFRYQAISRGKAAPDGLNYCLSYDMVETGIFYNKDLFRKVRVEVPKTWDEYLVTLKKLKEAGYIPIGMALEFFNDWCEDLFFDQLYYNLLPGIDLLQDPAREGYLQGYLDWDEIYFLHGKGFFTPEDPRWRNLWQLMYDFRQYSNKDFPQEGWDLLRDFVTQRSAMTWNSSAVTARLAKDRDLEFEWGVFYLPQFTRATSPYASEVPMCVIGGSATQLEVSNSAFSDTGDPTTSERLKRVIAFLQFLCLPENCDTIVNEYPCFIANIKGVSVLPVLRPFEEILDRRYTTTKWTFTFDLKFFEIQRRMLDLYLNDGISLDEFLAWQEDNITAACANLEQRKPIDVQRLQESWDGRAAARATMKGLPSE